MTLNPLIILTGQAFFHPVVAGLFFGYLPAQICDCHENRDFKVARIHRNYDSATACDTVIAVERLPTEAKITVSWQTKNIRNDSVLHVFVDSDEALRVIILDPFENIEYVFAETCEARNTMIEFACENRELIALASTSHFCHLAHSLIFNHDVASADFHCLRLLRHFILKRRADCLCFFEIFHVAAEFFINLLQCTKFFLNFCKQTLLTVGVRLLVRLQTKNRAMLTQ